MCQKVSLINLNVCMREGRLRISRMLTCGEAVGTDDTHCVFMAAKVVPSLK